MKFAWTILYVPNVPEAVAFYEKAFGLTVRFVHEGNDYAEMETGSTALAFVSEELAQSNFSVTYERAQLQKAPPPFEITFVTDALDEAYEKAVAAGATPVLPPTKKPWGQRTSYVRDIHGILVSLSSEVAP